jgi:hypothetical protein
MMNEPSADPSSDISNIPPRRGFFARIAGAAALGVAGFMSAPAEARAAADGGPDWPGQLKGRHRQAVDAYQVNGGTPLLYTASFLTTNPSPGAATGVLILRSGALPIGLNNAMWEKNKIGEALKIMDPETKVPAVKNPFFQPKTGILMMEEMAVDRLLADGVIIGACNLALHTLSKRLASNAGVSAEDAAKEWTANIIAGVTVIPSGTWGLNRAQEAGCTSCSGG